MNTHEKMAEIFQRKFDSLPGVILPVDHGGGREAIKLKRHLKGKNFLFYQRPDATRPESHCLDQSNNYLRGESRTIETPPREIVSFIEKHSSRDKIKWVTVLESETKSDPTSLIGAWEYCVRNAKQFGPLNYHNIYTALVKDPTGIADISPDGEPDREFNGTLDYVRKNCLNTYFSLIGDGILDPQDDDQSLISHYPSRRKVLDYAAALLLGRNPDFIKSVVRKVYSKQA